MDNFSEEDVITIILKLKNIIKNKKIYIYSIFIYIFENIRFDDNRYTEKFISKTTCNFFSFEEKDYFLNLILNFNNYKLKHFIKNFLNEKIKDYFLVTKILQILPKINYNIDDYWLDEYERRGEEVFYYKQLIKEKIEILKYLYQKYKKIKRKRKIDFEFTVYPKRKKLTV